MLLRIDDHQQATVTIFPCHAKVSSYLLDASISLHCLTLTAGVRRQTFFTQIFRHPHLLNLSQIANEFVELL